MVAEKVIYGGSVPYRNMCRFNSGFFYRHELLQNYRYYWRVEPNVKFFCDLDYDPFLIMQDQKKIYGFTISLFEYQATIPTLWETVRGMSLLVFITLYFVHIRHFPRVYREEPRFSRQRQRHVFPF